MPDWHSQTEIVNLWDQNASSRINTEPRPPLYNNTLPHVSMDLQTKLQEQFLVQYEILDPKHAAHVV